MNLVLIKISIVVLFILTSLYLVCDKVYQIGYAKAETKYVKIIEEHNKLVEQKILQIEKHTSSLAKKQANKEVKLAKDITQILADLKTQPVVIEKEGKCTPSLEFIDSINKAIDRASGK